MLVGTLYEYVPTGSRTRQCRSPSEMWFPRPGVGHWANVTFGTERREIISLTRTSLLTPQRGSKQGMKLGTQYDVFLVCPKALRRNVRVLEHSNPLSTCLVMESDKPGSPKLAPSKDELPRIHSIGSLGGGSDHSANKHCGLKRTAQPLKDC